MKSLQLPLHLVSIGLWLGCILTEALFERTLLGRGREQELLLAGIQALCSCVGWQLGGIRTCRLSSAQSWCDRLGWHFNRAWHRTLLTWTRLISGQAEGPSYRASAIIYCGCRSPLT